MRTDVHVRLQALLLQFFCPDDVIVDTSTLVSVSAILAEDGLDVISVSPTQQACREA